MTTRKQDMDFIDDVIGSGLLDTAINWIQKNMEPTDVFDKDRLAEWASSNGWIEEEA